MVFGYCFFAVVGILIVGSNFGSFITSLYCLGTIYSVPPFRIKRLPVAAFLIIATVRGFLLNLGYNLKLEVERLKKEKKLSFALSPGSFFFNQNILTSLSYVYNHQTHFSLPFPPLKYPPILSLMHAATCFAPKHI